MISRSAASAVGLTVVLAGLAGGDDGVLEINQAQALAGGVTEDDDPGFPVTLSESGSYVLTGNLTVPDADTDAIEVAARHVTVDLNGFAILGPTICNVGVSTSCTNTGTGRGVYNAVPAFNHTTVTNGSIRGVGADAIALSFASRVTGVRIASNGGAGIVVSNHGTVAGKTVRGNGGDGISTVQGSAISGNTVAANVGNGIVTAGGCTVSENTVTDNLLSGITATTGSRVTGNTVAFNDGVGLALQSTVGYADNVLQGNAGTVTSGVEIGTNLCDGSTSCP